MVAVHEPLEKRGEWPPPSLGRRSQEHPSAMVNKRISDSAAGNRFLVPLRRSCGYRGDILSPRASMTENARIPQFIHSAFP